MWRHELHSSQFLAGPIHDKVYQKYFKNIFTQAETQSIVRAKKLQYYLTALKNYEKNLLSGEDTVFTKLEYGVFMQAYGEVFDAKGNKLKSIFRNSTGFSFEQELGHVQMALKRIFENPSSALDKEDKQKEFLGQIIIGGDKTKINFPTQAMMSATIQSVLQHTGTRTTKWYSQEVKKASKKSGKTEGIVRYIQDVQPKIDLATDRMTLSFPQMFEYPHLAEFASLFSKATISAKNYSNYSINKFGVSVGRTNMFRILADFIPTLDLIEDREQEISFQYAIFKRDMQLAKEKVNADDEIQQHFSHIQNVYELMGVGQNYYNKDNTIKELNDYLKQGVEFLIVNIYTNDAIIVKSTRELLSQIYKVNFQGKHQANYLHHLSASFLT